MKKIILSIFIVFSLASCTQMSDPNDGFFKSDRDVYFTKNRIDYSFAGKDLQKETLKIPVKITGTASDKPLKFRISVIKEETTAKEGQQYIVDEFFEIPTKSFDGEVSVQVGREGLVDSETQSAIITLRLESTNDLKTSFENERKFTIQIEDRYKVPNFWGYGFWGDFTQIKIAKFLEFYGCKTVEEAEEKVEKATITWDFDEIKSATLKLKKYFEDHPEKGQTVPPFPF